MPCPRKTFALLPLLCLFFCCLFLQPAPLAAQAVKDTARGVPVVFERDTLFRIYSRLGPYSAKERATAVQQRLEMISEEMMFREDSFKVSISPEGADIMFGDKNVMSITPADARANGRPLPEMAEDYRGILTARIVPELQASRIKTIAIEIALTLLVLVALYFMIKWVNRLFAWLNRWLDSQQGRWIRGITIRNYEFLNIAQQLRAIHFVANALRILIILLLLYLALPVIFSIFPWTEDIATRLFRYVFSPFKKMFLAIINYIPNLFTILVIFFVIRYLVKFLRFLAKEVETGELQIGGFYPDWAKPTYNVLRFLLYAFMFILIFPYLPGSDSPVFRGVSVFLGILFSLGSSSAISNVVAGLVITYMRPFRVGDRVKIGEITGDVLEKNMLVTRLRTIKNEEITVPNAAVLSGHTINYSTTAETFGLILHTTVDHRL